MARSRTIYQTEAIYVSDNIDSITKSEHKNISRVQSANYGFSINLEKVNQYGQLGEIDSVLVEAPNVDFEMSYYLTNGDNEYFLNLDTGYGGFLKNQIVSSGQNIYVVNIPEGKDIQDQNWSDFSVIGVGNAFVTDYTVDFGVGQTSRVNVGFSALNISSQTNLTKTSGHFIGIENAGVNPLNGVKSTQQIEVLAEINQSGQSAIRPSDTSITITPTKTQLILNSGISGTRYSGYYNDNVNFSRATVQAQYYTNSIQQGDFGSYYTTEFVGFFRARHNGAYSFRVASDDASYLWIGDQATGGFTTSNATINNGGIHGDTSKSANVTLQSGKVYGFRVMQGENAGGANFNVWFTPPGGTETSNFAGYFYTYSGSNKIDPEVLNVQNDSGFYNFTSNASGMIGGDDSISILSTLDSGAHIQTASLNVNLDRTSLQRLGSNLAYAKVVEPPTTATVSISAIVNEVKSSSLSDILDHSNEYTIEIESVDPDGYQLCKYSLVGAKLDSESFGSAIGSNKVVDLTFTTQLGGIGQTNYNMFFEKYGFLDFFPSAAAAYSLRNLTADFDQKVVRVRRESDNSERDFTEYDIKNGTMVDWVNKQVIRPLDIRELDDANGNRPDTNDFIDTPAAAYSLRSLGENQANITINDPSDERNGETGKYVVQTRRNVDGATKSFTADEVADGTMENWVEGWELYTPSNKTLRNEPYWDLIPTDNQNFRIISNNADSESASWSEVQLVDPQDVKVGRNLVTFDVTVNSGTLNTGDTATSLSLYGRDGSHSANSSDIKQLNEGFNSHILETVDNAFGYPIAIFLSSGPNSKFDVTISNLKVYKSTVNELPLDQATGAAAAYSLRKLKEDFTGDVVEVRRNLDGETEGFTAHEVADGRLENWVEGWEEVTELVDNSNYGASSLNFTYVDSRNFTFDFNGYNGFDYDLLRFSLFKPGKHRVTFDLTVNEGTDGDTIIGSARKFYIASRDGDGDTFHTANIYELQEGFNDITLTSKDNLKDASPKIFFQAAYSVNKTFNITISNLKVYESAVNELPLDQATGAAAAYSLRNLSSSGTDVTGSFSFNGADGNSATHNGELFIVSGTRDGKLEYSTANGNAGIHWSSNNNGYWVLYDYDLSSVTARSSDSTDDYPWQATWGGQGQGDDDDLNNATFNTNTGKYVVQVRRSSDDAVKSFTASEVADGTLEDWVNADVDKLDLGAKVPGGGLAGNYTSGTDSADFSVSNEGSTGYGYLLDNSDVGAGSYEITFDVVLNSGSLSGIAIVINDPTNYQPQNIASGSNSFSGTVANTGSIYFRTSGTSVADVSITNITLTQTTANGHVRTWYDQSGSGNHAVQTTAAKQPKIVEGGTYLGDVHFDGSDDYLSSSDIGAYQSSDGVGFFCAYSKDVASTSDTFTGTNPQYLLQLRDTGLTDTTFAARVLGGKLNVIRAGEVSGFVTTTSDAHTIGTDLVLSSVTGTQAVDLFEDGSELSLQTDESGLTYDSATTNLIIGSQNTGTRFLDGGIKEMIIYKSDQSTKRRAIEENIANHYNISLAAFSRDGTVSTWYDQSGSTPANDATQTDPTKQPKIVEGGTLNKLNGNPAIFNNGTYFDLTTTIDQDDFTNLMVYGYDFDQNGTYIPFGSNTDYARFRPDENEFSFILDGEVSNINRINSSVGFSIGGINLIGFNRGASNVVNFYNNGTLEGSDAPEEIDGTFSISRLFSRHPNADWNILRGYVSEVILYSSDQSTKRRAIEENIANHYENITLAPFSRDGTVSTWYDQSGNTNDATQTDPTKQPKIVVNGTYLGEVDFLDGTATFLETTNSDLCNVSELSVFTVLKPHLAPSQTTAFSCGSVVAASSSYGGWKLNLNGYTDVADFQTQAVGNSALTSVGPSVTAADTLLSYVATFPNVSTFANGQAGATTTSAVSPNNTNEAIRRFRIGCQYTFQTAAFYTKPIKEIIIYDSDQSANRTAIEANIGEHYGIVGIPAFDNEVNGFVQTWYDQSGEGDDAVQNTASYQPKIVDSGALVTRNINGTVSPSIKFGASNKMYHGITSLSADGQQSLFFVADNQVTSGDSTRLLEIMSTSDHSTGRNRRPLIYKNSGQTIVFSVDSLGGISVTAANSDQVSAYSSITDDTSEGTHTVYQDGTQVGSATAVTLDANPTISTNKQLGNLASNTVGNFYFTEIVYYNSDQSSNRTAIETNIANHYGITLS